ncbi:hypothetical protein ACKQTC_06555 [Peptococcus simiae]|uniref:Arginine/lysine/ornithine decarboxylase n=1 Tax=Peptococcus simiae TaxID=1643805 RepID=A0ABW9GZP0_9FIRM
MGNFLWQALTAYTDKNRQSAHTPGHGAGQVVPPRLAAAWGEAIFRYDQTELPGLDVLAEAEGVLAQSQADVAACHGVAFARYLVGGSTAGILAMCLAFCRQETVLVPRHAHHSIRNGLVLADARAIDLPVDIDPRTGAILGVSKANLEAALAAHPEARVFWHIDPSYDGARALEALSAARAAGLLILTDGAHGAHYGFHPAYPRPAEGDVRVVSSHKTLPVLTGASLLLGRSSAQEEALDRALQMVQTSSPSYLMLAALEAAYDWLPTAAAQAQMTEGLARLAALRRDLAGTPLAVTVYDDPLRWTLSAPGLTGLALAERLAALGLDVELANSRTALLLWPLTGPRVGGARALKALAGQLTPGPDRRPPLAPLPLPRVYLAPQTALAAPSKLVPLAEAAGAIAADSLEVTPPAIPLVLPGEEISPAIIEAALAAGLSPTRLVAVLEETP